MNYTCIKACLVVLLLYPLITQAQPFAYQQAVLYLLKKDFTAAPGTKQAAYIMQLEKADDTSFICRYYHLAGPMVRQESYLDSDLTIPNGQFAWYDKDGDIDSSATVSRGKKVNFVSYDDKLKPLIFMRFRDGVIYEKRDHHRNTYTDSAGNTSDLRQKEKAEREISIAYIRAARAIPAKFGENGSAEWNTYMQNHLSVPDRFTHIMKQGTYTDIISFLISEDGTITELLLLRSSELSADLELLNVLKNAPPWHPATMDGKPVIYRQKESATFEVGY